MVVSVPLRGLWFLSSKRRIEDRQTQGDEFPSPCGDYGSYLLPTYVPSFLNGLSFPSPCGDYGSYLRRTDEEYEDKDEGFRPLAGIMVLIRSGAVILLP